MDQEVASPKVVEKNEHGTRGMLVGLICAIVVAVIGITFGVYGMVTRGDGEPSASQDNIEDTDEEIAVQMMAEDYNEVFDLVQKVVQEVGAEWFDIQNGYELLYKPDDLDVYVPMKIQVEANLYHLGSTEDGMTALREQLGKDGFEYLGELPTLGLVYGYLLDDIVCGVNGGQDYSGEYATLQCAKTDWTLLTDEEKALKNELAVAYYNKTGKHPTAIGRLVSQVRDSEYAPYQTLDVDMIGGIGLFYRVSPEAEWQYFTGTNGIVPCEEYDTVDLKRAYLGRACYGLGGSEELTVQL